MARIERANADYPSAKVAANAGQSQFDLSFTNSLENRAIPVFQTEVSSFICNEIEQFRKATFVIIANGARSIWLDPLRILGA